MHEGLWEKLVELDPKTVAHNAQCAHCDKSGCFAISLLNRRYEVCPEERTIFPENMPTCKQAGFIEQLCILAYLINIKDFPLCPEVVSPEKLEGGQFFFRGPHELPTKKLEDVFGRTPERLFEASSSLETEQCDYGDASIQISVLPKFPVVIVIWAEDEEFPARASFLFNRSISGQIPLDAVWATVNLTADTIMQAVS